MPVQKVANPIGSNGEAIIPRDVSAQSPGVTTDVRLIYQKEIMSAYVLIHIAQVSTCKSLP